MPLTAGVVGGGALIGGAASLFGGKSQANAAQQSAAIQLQAARESIRSQQQGADRAFDIFQSEAAKSRKYLKQANAQARQDLAPLRRLGLQNLRTASQFTDPNSPLAQQERDAFQRTLANNLSARGLTGSRVETAGLGNFELGLAQQRKDLSLQLAGIGGNALNSLSGLSSGLGQGLAGISQNLGNTGGSLYGNLGQSIGGTLLQSGQMQGNSLIAQAQAQAQGLIGINNAFQNAGQGFLNYRNQQTANAQNQQYLNLLGGGGLSSLSSSPSSGFTKYNASLNYKNPFATSS